MKKEDIYKKIKSLKEGDTFVDDQGYKCHVVTNLPKESGGKIVWKYYGKHKQWWHYVIESYFWFELRMRTDSSDKTFGGKNPLKIKIKKNNK